jgi:NAD(P)H-dependent flavin oxidoreductase YrpB (nitropropane dioxygenase family)
MEHLSTRLTELLRIQHPILLASMDIVADGRLAAAVSCAGGFGIIGGGYGDEAWLTREMDAAGDARVGVGFITWSMARRPRLLDMVLERRPPAVMLSFGDVQPHATRSRAPVRCLFAKCKHLSKRKTPSRMAPTSSSPRAAKLAVTVSHAVRSRSFPPSWTKLRILQLLRRGE